MATIAEILRMSVDERKREYKATGIDTYGDKPIGIDVVVIEGIRFTDYKAFSFIWEKSYVKSPERSGKGTIDNLDSFATFLTPHLKIDFSMLSIDSYRVLMRDLVYKKNEFLVICYDVVNDQMTTNKMYFTTEEMPKLWTIARALNGEEWTELVGVQDYTVEMVGTNVDLDEVKVYYHDDKGAMIAEATQYVVKGSDAIIRYNYVAPQGKHFDGWWSTTRGAQFTDANAKYYNGMAVMLINDLHLYPILADTGEYILSIDYGKGKQVIARADGQPITKLTAIYDESSPKTLGDIFYSAEINTTVGGWYTFPINGTGVDDIEYELGGERKQIAGKEVYSFRGWFWTPEENEKTEVTWQTPYTFNFNRTIYQIYKAIPHSVTYITGVEGFTIDPIYYGYGETITLPKIARDGYLFKGWALDMKKGENNPVAPTIMPPVNITVVAVWEKIED